MTVCCAAYHWKPIGRFILGTAVSALFCLTAASFTQADTPVIASGHPLQKGLLSCTDQNNLNALLNRPRLTQNDWVEITALNQKACQATALILKANPAKKSYLYLSFGDLRWLPIGQGDIDAARQLDPAAGRTQFSIGQSF